MSHHDTGSCQTTRREQDAQGRGEIEIRTQGSFYGVGLRAIEPSSPSKVDITYCSDVTVVDAQSSILPLYDEESTKPVATSLHKPGGQVRLGVTANWPPTNAAPPCATSGPLVI